MPSLLGARAVEEATCFGKAIVKFISPNDVGQTGGHQCGYYLPKSIWRMFTALPPEKGTNAEAEVAVLWPDGRTTQSRVKWYGKGTKSEYRLTRFGKDFPWLTFDNVGDLLVIIPVDHGNFRAHILDLEDDIEELRAGLGLGVFERWATYEAGTLPAESEDECLERKFTEFTAAITDFPSGDQFSNETQTVLENCIASFRSQDADAALMKCVEVEYQLFRRVERQLCQHEIARLFRDVDDFIETAHRLLNRRKARAGRSLENHAHYVLERAAIPHEMRASGVDGEPDIVIPGQQAYNDPDYPDRKLCIVGVKTTCKDRWRQVLNEAKRVRRKYILTVQPTISSTQLAEMHKAGVSLVVPKRLHKDYPPRTSIELLSIEDFVRSVKARLS